MCLFMKIIIVSVAKNQRLFRLPRSEPILRCHRCSTPAHFCRIRQLAVVTRTSRHGNDGLAYFPQFQTIARHGHSCMLNPFWKQIFQILNDIYVRLMMHFFCHENSLFCTPNPIFAQTPPIFAQTNPIFADKFSPRVLYSEMFATFRTQSRCSHGSSTSPVYPPPGRPDPPHRPTLALPPRSPPRPAPPPPLIASISLVTSSTAPLRRRTPRSLLPTTCRAAIPPLFAQTPLLFAQTPN